MHRLPKRLQPFTCYFFILGVKQETKRSELLNRLETSGYWFKVIYTPINVKIYISIALRGSVHVWYNRRRLLLRREFTVGVGYIVQKVVGDNVVQLREESQYNELLNGIQ